MKKVCGIYEIYNTANGKRYVGQSVDIYHRFAVHNSLLKYAQHANKHLQGAYDKYGPDIFEFRVLAELPVCRPDSAEKSFIKEFNSSDPAFGYNMDAGGVAHRTFTEETRVKMSRSHIGKTASEETKALMSIARRGKKMSEEARQNISKAAYLRPKRVASTSSKEKCSVTLKRKWADPEFRAMMLAARGAVATEES